jgi:hypothetical protein
MEKASFVLTVPVSNISNFNSKINMLNKKAAKLGLDAIVVTKISKPYSHKVVVKSPISDYDIWTDVVDYKIEGSIPHISGWAIVGVIDYVDGVNIVKSMEGIPELFRTREPFCDHCHTKRVKLNTVVIKNIDTGEYMQVGKTCLKDFVNTETKDALSYNASFVSLKEEETEDFINEKGKFELKAGVIDVLTVASAMIKKFGYVSVSNEDYSIGRVATKQMVIEYFFGKEKRDFLDIDPSDSELAQKVVEFINTSSSKSEFIYNTQEIIKLGTVAPKYFGYVVGAIAFYHKAVVTETESVKRVNEYYPSPVSSKIKVDVTVKNITVLDSYYGTSWLCSFVDAEGRSIVAFCSRPISAEIGSSKQVSGTIKKFQEYNGTKQTVLTRIKLS